jgi:hypothetical protein
MIDNHFIMFILREVFPDKFKCMSLDNLDFLVMSAPDEAIFRNST